MISSKGYKIGVFLFILLSLSLISFKSFAKNYNFLFQSSDAEGNQNFIAQQKMLKKIEGDTKGKVKIKLLPVGTLMGHSETLNAVGKGALDGHITATEYFGAIEPALTLIGNPVSAWRSSFQMLEFFNKAGGNELLREIYQPLGVYFIGASTPGLEAFVSRLPLEGVADLRGLKIRAPAGLIGDTFKAFGAIPVDMPGGDVKKALELKVIDASDFTVFHTNHALGLNNVARNPVYPGFHSMALVEVSMNLNKWNLLPKNLQKIISKNVESYAINLARSVDAKDLAAVKQAKASGIKVHNWSKNQRDKFRAVAQKQWALYAKKSPQAQKVYKAISNFLNSKK